jgi:hypothetical protein
MYRLLLVYVNTNHISHPKNRDKGKIEDDAKKLKMVIMESTAHGWAPTTLRITGAQLKLVCVFLSSFPMSV